MEKHAPLATASENVEYGVQDFTKTVGPRSSVSLGGRAGEAQGDSIGHRKDPLGEVFSYLLELWITTPRPLFIQSLHAIR